MALVTCRECGRQVSDQAAACPGCGAPLGRSSAHSVVVKHRPGGCITAITYLIVLIGLFALLGTCISRNEDHLDATRKSVAPATLPVASEPPPDASVRARWRSTGAQGSMTFVAITDPSGTRAEYYDAAAYICQQATHCFVNFWIGLDGAPRHLPLSRKQVLSQAASYRRNRVTGLDTWSWNCKKFKDAGPNECWTPE